MTYYITALVISLMLSAFFSAAEVAFISLSNPKIEAMIRRKLPRSKLVKLLKKNPRRLLITILIGNNLVNISAASFGTVIAIHYFQSNAIGIATGLMTFLVLVFGEIIPKSYAANHNKRLAIFCAPFLRAMEFVGFPIIWLFEKITMLFAGEHVEEKVSEEELRALVNTAGRQGAIETDEHDMIERLFRFNDITVEDIMTPRVKCIYLQDTLSIEEATKIVERHPHTRFPVVTQTPDNIIGFAHSRDLLVAFSHDTEKKSIKDIILPILRVPRQMRLDAVLEEFQKAKKHIAVVQDELGGTEGIVTLEDVLEELVGEIADEHDVQDNIIKRINKNTILVSGDEEISDINEFFNIAIPGNDFDTIAEVILNHVQTAPRKNMALEFDNVRIQVVSVKKRAIEHVRITKL